MKEKLPYEKLIAEKMQDLTVPDKDVAWQKMENLLDSKMPVSLPSGRKLPGRQWWWAGAAVVTMVSALLIVQNKAPVSNKPAVPPSAQVEVRAADEIIPHHHTTNPGNIEDRSTQNAPLSNLPAKRSPGTPEQQNNIAVDPEKDPRTTQAASFPETNVLPPAPNTRREDNKPQAQASPRPLVKRANTGAGSEQDSVNEGIASAIIPSAKKEPEERMPAAVLQADSSSSLSPEEKIIEGTLQHITPASLPPLVYAGNGNAGRLEVPADVYALPEISVSTKIAMLRTLKHRNRKLERALARSQKTSPGIWGQKTDRWFAAGIAPYQNFAVASQQAFHYNANASHNTAADYIPSPYLQWRVTSRVYILSEFQFNAPQATPELLLSQKRFNLPMSAGNCTENVYLRKLYYFNMPVSFYYSPLKNFYVGTGLQYSSFNSGLAYLEQLAPNNDLMYSEIFKVKGGQLASKIKTSEWRYLFDANYFINRLMIGFRYNQAMGDYINFRVNNWGTPTRARNQAFQFYLRYNIVVGRRH